MIKNKINPFKLCKKKYLENFENFVQFSLFKFMNSDVTISIFRDFCHEGKRRLKKVLEGIFPFKPPFQKTHTHKRVFFTEQK